MGGGALTQAERGFLLLTSQLGDPGRKPLTVAQLRELRRRVDAMDRTDEDRSVEIRDFLSVGYSEGFARHIVALLEQEDLLDWYLGQAWKNGCIPVTRATESYPILVRRRLGSDSPGVLWAKGNLSLLNVPAVSLVGSRELEPANRAFAQAVGTVAAENGLVLVSGNARGADKAAQNACLSAGGRVISIVADDLRSHRVRDNVLYLSETGFDGEFSAQRALSRNRVIHAMGRITFVAQSSLEKGGTWDGTVKNLRHGWSPVACFRDGSPASQMLETLGAYLIDREDIGACLSFPPEQISFF